MIGKADLNWSVAERYDGTVPGLTPDEFRRYVKAELDGSASNQEINQLFLDISKDDRKIYQSDFDAYQDTGRVSGGYGPDGNVVFNWEDAKRFDGTVEGLTREEFSDYIKDGYGNTYSEDEINDMFNLLDVRTDNKVYRSEMALFSDDVTSPPSNDVVSPPPSREVPAVLEHGQIGAYSDRSFTAPSDRGVVLLVARSAGRDKNPVDRGFFGVSGNAELIGFTGSSDKAGALFRVDAGETVSISAKRDANGNVINTSGRQFVVFDARDARVLNPGTDGIRDTGYPDHVEGHSDADMTIALNDEGINPDNERHNRAITGASLQTFFGGHDDQIHLLPGNLEKVKWVNDGDEGVYYPPGINGGDARLNGALMHVDFI